MTPATAILEPSCPVVTTILDTPFIDPTLPDWFQALQQQGWETFRSLPLPSRKNEAWRFTNLKALELHPFIPATPLADAMKQSVLDRSVALSDTAGKLVFGNGQLLSRVNPPSELIEKGVLFLPLEEALESYPDLVQKYFMTRETRLGSAKFAALHQAHAGAGTLVYVPRNVEIALPLEIFHWLDGENAALFPHTLIIAGENSRVTVLEHLSSTTEQAPGLACSVNDLVLAPGARLTYVVSQDWNEAVTSFQINSTEVDRDASAIHLGLHLGGRYARYESLSRMHGPGGRSDMLAVTVADKNQEFDQRTFQDHTAPHCTSDLLYKNALSDQSRTIFAGLIKVEEHCHKTDAYQKVRNLLLSDEAEANSMPGLEILADDVRCSHGATSGQLDQEEIFYLLSRGIDEPAARQLLVSGFLNEAVARLGHPAIESLLNARIAAKFTTISPACHGDHSPH